MSLDRDRWSALCARLDCRAGPSRFALLDAAYGEGHRTYHNRRHIAECLTLFDSLRDLCEHPDEVEFAIWMHDVVYGPRRSDNEEKSAELASSWLEADEVPRAIVRRIHDLILATRHGDPPQARDEEVLVDIDLHILGSSPDRFDEYEEQVRQEYGWVPSLIFRRRRAALLREFLARETLYFTAACRDRFEQRARSNLRRSLQRLSSGR